MSAGKRSCPDIICYLLSVITKSLSSLLSLELFALRTLRKVGIDSPTVCHWHCLAPSSARSRARLGARGLHVRTATLRLLFLLFILFTLYSLRWSHLRAYTAPARALPRDTPNTRALTRLSPQAPSFKPEDPPSRPGCARRRVASRIERGLPQAQPVNVAHGDNLRDQERGA